MMLSLGSFTPEWFGDAAKPSEANVLASSNHVGSLAIRTRSVPAVQDSGLNALIMVVLLTTATFFLSKRRRFSLHQKLKDTVDATPLNSIPEELPIHYISQKDLDDEDQDNNKYRTELAVKQRSPPFCDLCYKDYSLGDAVVQPSSCSRFVCHDCYDDWISQQDPEMV